MTFRELIKTSKAIVDGRMHFEPLSRFYGSPVFKAKKSNLQEMDVRHIQEELYARGIYSHLETGRKNIYLKVIRSESAKSRPKYLIHVILFILTVVTTTLTGAMLRGHNPFASLNEFSTGFKYSFALMSILFAHEMGHYLASRYYRVRVTLPYFIPLFLPAFHPGTLGAFIKMRSPIPNRRALFDIGIAGPLAGFVLSLIFLTVGFAQLPGQAEIYHIIEQIHPINEDATGINLVLGNTLIYDGISNVFGASRLPMNEMYHFPFIFAGWFGLLVTAINLMPIGQLDGGHITFALFGDRARLVAISTFALLVFLNVYLISNFDSYVWVLWSLLILVFIRFRHPPTLDDSVRLSTGRRVLGWASYFIFIACFSPMPFYIANL